MTNEQELKTEIENCINNWKSNHYQFGWKDVYESEKYLILKAELKGFQQGKQEREKVLKEVDDLLIELNDNIDELQMDYARLDTCLKEDAQDLIEGVRMNLYNYYKQELSKLQEKKE